MPRPRFHKLDKAKRDRIIEIAGTEFGQKGFKAASLNAILEAAEISKGAFYYYFDDKTDLFVTVITAVRDEILEAGDVDLATLTPERFWSTIDTLCMRGVEYVEHHPWILEVGRMLHTLADDPELREMIAPLFTEAIEYTRTLLTRGQELGEVRTDLPLDLLITLTRGLDVAFDRWILNNWSRFERKELAFYAHQAVDLMRRILAP